MSNDYHIRLDKTGRHKLSSKLDFTITTPKGSVMTGKELHFYAQAGDVARITANGSTISIVYVGDLQSNHNTL